MTRRRRKTPVDPQAKYDAAGQGRRIASWRPPSSGPNNALTGLQSIRNRARDVTRNDWAGESATQKWSTNLVGVGIVPRWKGATFGERWRAWVPSADADNVFDFYGLQTLATRAWLDGGEVFLRRRPRPAVEKERAPLQVQLIEAEFCPLFDADVWPGLPRGNTIRQGIERDRRGARVAFWFYREHPGDAAAGLMPNIEQLVRVPARDVAHVFEPKRPGQLRGVPQLAPVLVRVRASDDFEDAVLDRQKLANLFTMFITQQMPPDTADIDYDPLTGLPTFFDAQGKALVGLEPGLSQKLNPGEDVKFANPPEAGTTFSDYMRTTHLGTASGAGLPYELFSGDLRDVSDRTLRVIMNEFRRFAQQRQWQILIPQLCQRVVEWWAEAEVLGGSLSLADLTAARAPTWSPHGWEYIHPTQDAEGKKIEVEAGFRSRSDVIGERGDDPDEVDRERAEDLKRSKSLGLEPPAPALTPVKAKPKPSPQALELDDLTLRRARAEVRALEHPPEPAGPSPMEHMIAGLMAQSTAMLGQVAALAAREQPAPVVNVSPTPVENVVNVSPTPVENVVNVSPTPVENVVNVAPAEARGFVIRRDDEGRVAGVAPAEPEPPTAH